MLSGVEAAMVEVLRSHGPVMERGAFEERCLDRGINRFSFNATLMASPVICQFGRSVYGLVGSAISRRKVQAMVAKSRGAAPERVLRGAGTLGDGRLFLSYKLSKAAIAGGVTTVPAAIKARLAGRFTIRTPDGAEVGQLVVRDGCAWGLSDLPFAASTLVPATTWSCSSTPKHTWPRFTWENRDLLDTLVESLQLRQAVRSAVSRQVS